MGRGSYYRRKYKRKYSRRYKSYYKRRYGRGFRRRTTRGGRKYARKTQGILRKYFYQRRKRQYAAARRAGMYNFQAYGRAAPPAGFKNSRDGTPNVNRRYRGRNGSKMGSNGISDFGPQIPTGFKLGKGGYSGDPQGEYAPWQAPNPFDDYAPNPFDDYEEYVNPFDDVDEFAGMPDLEPTADYEAEVNRKRSRADTRAASKRSRESRRVHFGQGGAFIQGG